MYIWMALSGTLLIGTEIIKKLNAPIPFIFIIIIKNLQHIYSSRYFIEQREKLITQNSIPYIIEGQEHY